MLILYTVSCLASIPYTNSYNSVSQHKQYTFIYMIKIYHKWKSAALTVVFQESKTVYSPMVELVVSLSAHKLKYVVVTHSHSSERFV